MNLEQVARTLKNYESFLLTTHTHPDGDGLGCQLALASILKLLGKKVYVVNSDPTPPRYQDYLKSVESSTLPDRLDCLIVLDTSEYPRVGKLQYRIQGTFERVVYIDHHISQTSKDDTHWVDTGAAATAEMIYKLSDYLGVWNLDIAMGVYLGLITDTHWFKNGRASSLCYHIAEKCVKAGVNPSEVYQKVYCNTNPDWMKFLGTLLQRVEYALERRVAYVSIPKTLRAQFHVGIEEIYTLIENLMDLANVDVGVVLREEEDGKTRVSLRSRSSISVLPVAEKLKGGGHREAAGALLYGGLEDSVKEVLKTMEDILEF